MDDHRRSRWRTGAFFASLGLHLAAVGFLLSRVETPSAPPSPPVLVSLVPVAPPPTAPDPPASPAKAPRPRVAAPAKAPRPSRAAPAPVSPRVVESAEPSPMQLTAGEFAGAAGAGEGDGDGANGGGGRGAGGGCGMPARVQAALRRDGLVRKALAVGGPSSTAFRMWDGDWVRDPREDGKGLAAVREAILWAVGFAPAQCRAEAVRGLVIVSVDTSAGRVRLALGAAAWRWSDLLSAR